MNTNVSSSQCYPHLPKWGPTPGAKSTCDESMSHLSSNHSDAYVHRQLTITSVLEARVAFASN